MILSPVWEAPADSFPHFENSIKKNFNNSDLNPVLSA